MKLRQAAAGNSLLQTMMTADFALLGNYYTRVEMLARQRLHEAGCGITHVYFPEGGIVSIIALTLDGSQYEVGLFGREGMSGTAAMLGTDHSPHETYVQVGGASALRLSISALNDAFEQSTTLRRHRLHYAHSMVIQLSSSITAAGETIELRLARWILMCHDRVDHDVITVTHEFIAMMLGVRRSSVTTALHDLSIRTLIATTRGKIEVLDRDGLEDVAAHCYGLAEVEYERLIGATLRKSMSAFKN